MKIPIEEIKIEDRIRKEHGNIDELAQNIEKNGLINPIVVTPDNQLIAGGRRLRACEKLGWDEIEAKVMDISEYEDKLMIEISENELRKNFTFSEKLEWAKKLERIEKVKAEERMKQGEKVEADETKTNVHPRQNFAGGGKGRTKEKVAEKIGLGSRENYRKAKFIEENADEEIIKKLDEDEISIHSAYQELKEKNEKLEEKNDDLKDRVKELNNDKQMLKDRMQTLEKELEDNSSEKLEEELEEVKEELKEKETTIEKLTSDLADVSRSEMKINTQKIDDICREMTVENSQALQQIKNKIKEKDINKSKVIDSLESWQNNLSKVKDEIETLIDTISQEVIINA